MESFLATKANSDHLVLIAHHIVIESVLWKQFQV